MHPAVRRLILFTLSALAGSSARAAAQAGSTASRGITPSVFAAASGVRTGLPSGRNLALTAGLDVVLFPNLHFHPALEYRASHALARGSVDSIDNNLAGLQVSRIYGRLRPYADLLAGRGETTYANAGYQVPGKPIFYTRSSSNVFSLGGGVDLLSTGHLALKLDLQAQRYSSPVTTSGHLYSETATAGIVYLFHIGNRPR